MAAQNTYIVLKKAHVFVEYVRRANESIPDASDGDIDGPAISVEPEPPKGE